MKMNVIEFCSFLCVFVLLGVMREILLHASICVLLVCFDYFLVAHLVIIELKSGILFLLISYRHEVFCL